MLELDLMTKAVSKAVTSREFFHPALSLTTSVPVSVPATFLAADNDSGRRSPEDRAGRHS